MGGPDDAAPAGPAVRVSVVIACRDAADFLAEQLAALAAQAVDEPWQLVIADNGSRDATLAVVEEHRRHFAVVDVVDASTCVGAGAVRNAGVRAARGEHVLFCDADDVVAPGWLAAMAAALDRSGLVAARLDHELLNEAWTRPARNPQDGLLDTDPAFLPYTFAAALGVRRSLHAELGGFDESFPEAGEDRDYCYRARLAGTPLVLVPDAVVHYRHRRTARGMYRQARGYGRANVRLYRDYRRLGLGRPPAGRALVSWALTLPKLPVALVTPHGFARWMSRLGWRVGRAEASLRYRVWAP